jgi:hypothetical protein
MTTIAQDSHEIFAKASSGAENPSSAAVQLLREASLLVRKIAAWRPEKGLSCWQRTDWRRERTVLQSFRFLASRPLTQAFRGYVEQRNDENPEDGCSDHAAEHRRAHRLARDGPGPPRDNQGQ